MSGGWWWVVAAACTAVMAAIMLVAWGGLLLVLWLWPGIAEVKGDSIANGEQARNRIFR